MASRGFIPGNVFTKSVKGEACRRPCNPWSSTTRARRSPTTSGCTPATACHSSGAPSGRQIPSRWRISHPPAMEASSPNPSLSSQAWSELVNGFCDLFIYFGIVSFVDLDPAMQASLRVLQGSCWREPKEFTSNQKLNLWSRQTARTVVALIYCINLYQIFMMSHIFMFVGRDPCMSTIIKILLYVQYIL